MDLSKLTDALGKPLSFGDLYGCSIKRAENTRVVIGNVIKATPAKKAVLKVRAVYTVFDGEFEEEPPEDHTPTMTFVPQLLFPVSSLPLKKAPQPPEGLEEMGRS